MAKPQINVSVALVQPFHALRDRALVREQGFIGGHWVNAQSAAVIAVDDPATGEVIGHVPDMGKHETEAAIAAAQAALPAWRARTGKERGIILRRWAELILQNLDDLAIIMTTEQGKILGEARAEVASSAAFLEWFAEEAKRAYGDIIPSPTAGRRLLVMKEPVGVVAAITPWNFPSSMIARKVGPALAAGCTVVLKPSELTPFSALALAVLAEQAGVPVGVFNVVTGDAKAIGGALTQSSVVRKLSFTGSTAVGKLLMAQCAATVKKLSLELGGNAPFIVFEDADLDAAVEGAIFAKFRNSGQTCICANRLYVQRGVYDRFVDKFVPAVEKLKVGSGTDGDATNGPLINARAIEKVERHIHDAIANGATLLTGGRRDARGGNFFEPSVLRDVTAAMAVAREETFGPLAPIISFADESDAVALANSTEYGLAAYFYGRDIGRIWRVAEALEFGMVGVNTGVIATEVAPFGGMKESGIGREGSKYGLDDYMETKLVCLGGL